MPIYTVENPGTGRIVEFEWTDAVPPTDADMEEVFIQAGDIGQPAQPIVDQPVTPQERPTSFLPTGEGLTQTQRQERAKKDILEVARPTLEMGGLLAGEAFGFIAGLPVPVPGAAALGAVAGGALGFAAGSNLADILEQKLGAREAKTVMEELRELPEEILTGAAYSAVGQGLGPVLKTVGLPIVAGVVGAGAGAYIDDENRMRGAMIGLSTGVVTTVLLRRSLSQKGLAKKAYDKLISELKGTERTQPQIDKNIRIAKGLEESIKKETGQDFKFTQGQLTNDASTIALERKLAKKGGEDLSQAQREYANTILDEYYAKKVVGPGQAKAFPEQVAKLKRGLEAATKEAEDAVNTEISRLSRHMDEQAMGKSLYTFLSKGKQAMKSKASTLYNKIPDAKLPSTNLNQGIDDLIKAEDGILEPKTQQMINLVRSKFTKDTPSKILDVHGLPMKGGRIGGNVRYQVLRKLRSKINRNAQASGSGATPNLEEARQLGMLSKHIDDAMRQVENVSPRVAEAYKKATSFYRDDYIPTFRQGTVADVLQRGARGEDTKIAMANIAKSFNSLDGIDDLARAVGNHRGVAAQAMKDFYAFDLLNAAQNKETMQLSSKAAASWLARNTGKLKKLGVYDDFANLANMQKIAAEYSKYLDTFNKSVAGRVLEADMDTMISNAFRSSKHLAVTARQLMNLTKGDEAARLGLQKAFGENIMRQSETTVPSFFQTGQTPPELEFFKGLAKMTSQIKKYTPALREIYKGEPEKIKALNIVWKAYLTLGRTARSPIGGGSDTFELFGKTLDIVAGSTAPGKWYAFKTIRDIVDRFSTQHVDVFLRKAIFDPDYAQTLANMAKGTVSEAKLNQLMTLISYEIGEELR